MQKILVGKYISNILKANRHILYGNVFGRPIQQWTYFDCYDDIVKQIVFF